MLSLTLSAYALIQGCKICCEISSTQKFLVVQTYNQLALSLLCDVRYATVDKLLGEFLNQCYIMSQSNDSASQIESKWKFELHKPQAVAFSHYKWHHKPE